MIGHSRSQCAKQSLNSAWSASRRALTSRAASAQEAMHEETVDWSLPITHAEVKHTMDTYSIGAAAPTATAGAWLHASSRPAATECQDCIPTGWIPS